MIHRFTTLRSGSKLAVAVMAGLLMAGGANAQGINLGGRDSGAPISVTADNFTGDFETKVGTYSGNVIVSQGNFKMRAQTVSVRVVKNKPSQIVASGHVIFDAPSGTASGKKGVYDLNQRKITLSGDVLLTKGKNVMRGTTLVVDLDSGKATLGAKGMAGGRVQGLFTPPTRSKGKQKK